MLPIVYFIVTASLIQNGHEKKREQEYRAGLRALRKSLREFPSIRSKVIIVENNGRRPTILDSLGADAVFYTDSNALPERNKGVKEMRDVFAVMNHYKIAGDDFVVKLTGRYSILPNSPFMRAVAERNHSTGAIVRYGWYDSKFGLPRRDEYIVSGLIGMKAKYVRQIEFTPNMNYPIEGKWAAVANRLPDENLVILRTLGIDMPVNDGPVKRARGGGGTRKRLLRHGDKNQRKEHE